MLPSFSGKIPLGDWYQWVYHMWRKTLQNKVSSSQILNSDFKQNLN